MNPKAAVKFTRTLALLYHVIEQSDIDLTMLEFSKMSARQMYSYLERLGYKYDEKKQDWVFDENL